MKRNFWIPWLTFPLIMDNLIARKKIHCASKLAQVKLFFKLIWNLLGPNQEMKEKRVKIIIFHILKAFFIKYFFLHDLMQKKKKNFAKKNNKKNKAPDR